MYYNFFNVAKLSGFLVVCILTLTEARGQEKSRIDSLSQALDLAKDKKDIAEIKLSLAAEYFYSDNERSYSHIEDAFQIAEQIGDTARIVKAGRIKGQLLWRMGRLHEAIDILSYVNPIAKRNSLNDDLKKILNALALAYTFQANYDKALEYNFESLVLREASGDMAEISITLQNIGFVYYKLSNFEEAIKYYLKSLELRREVNYDFDLDRLLINLGLCYNSIKGDDSKYDKAQSYFREALKFCGSDCSQQINLEAYFGLGISSFALGDVAQSKKYFNMSLEIARNTNAMVFEGENLVELAEILTMEKDYDVALDYLNQAEQIAKEYGYNQLMMEVYAQFAKTHNVIKNYQQEAQYQGKYIQLRDSLLGADLVKAIANIQTNYEERENMATIASNEIVIKQSRELSVAIAVIALLAGLLVLVLQFGNRNIKRVNAKLSEAKEVIQEKNQELANKNRELDSQVEKKTADLAKANSSLKQVNDELDNFIYKTSHDIRGPLASLKGMCNVALMDVTDPTALDYLRKLDATAERLNTILTRLVIINQINNSKLTIEHIDFEGIVSDVLLLERKKGVPNELLIIPQIDRDATIESDKELVRIVLENLIDNAIKFYNDSDRVKSFVKIHINSMPKGGVIVRVIDNGIGISESSPGKLFQMFSRASERSETGGIGLYITKTATEKIGGKVGLLTTPEGYTEFYVIFPPHPFNESERMLRASSF